ncbi:MAG: transaldolase [Candidatus Eisenbacteria bacterium]|uniref:Transaldolase n=1 Tax=Eiseniibacteriota bacterium TaxID=2212470 RepID=A0A849SDG7_UNCEI|nr:transaldolase [Candidatus Eisenbacteria bacterium]
MKSRAEQLLALGQSVWLDFIRRGHLHSGEFDRLVRDNGVVGVTSNPTIFQQAIADSHDYDAALQSGIAAGLDDLALYERLAIEDIQLACDRLLPLYRSTAGRDGRVSLEVSPRLSHDTAGSIEEGQRLHAAVARDNVMIKVPATVAGLPAIRALLGLGISVNVTLIFTLARYEQVIEAFLGGLEDRVARGGAPGDIRSVASFFVSRVDAKVDKAIETTLAALPPGATERAELETLPGRAAVANARLAYARFRVVFGSARWQALAAQGAHVQRPLWASTSTKNKSYRDVLYVEELIGPDTVNTMPPQTLAAFNDHGVAEARIERDVDAARRLFERLPALGIPLARLLDELEPEGVASFEKSFDALLSAIAQRRREMAA